ncbi:MAG: amino acid ABC transporter permease [Pseudorhodobacter sp.]|nr:amino acid ABC transporter permease [Pseudorhodobacter sp.]
MAPINSEDLVYVRSILLPEKAPPVTESGVVKWVRENLFAGPVNSLLTVLGLLVVLWGVQAAYPWLRHSVWTAGSLSECRDIITARWGEGATGACWAVIRDRWTQFIFGFYPNSLYYRPTLALGLLFFALAPVLFSENRRVRMTLLGVVTVLLVGALIRLGTWSVYSDLGLLAVLVACLLVLWKTPAKMLWFTGIYPFLAFWLMWGGSVWLPLVAMGGFVAGWLTLRLTRPLGSVVSLVATILAPLIWWLFLASPANTALDSALPFAIEAVRSDKFGGFVLALTIGISGIAMSLPLGIVLALGRQSDMFLVKTLSVGFIEFIRGVPLIALLFTASLLLNYFLPPGSNFDIILRVVIMVTLFAAAYIAEVVRGGLAALPRGQFEAADSLGLDYWKAQRLIILPQALKISIPGIVSTFIGLFKDTTLVVFVGLLDPLKGITDAVRASTDWKGVYWEPYIFVAAIFFVFNFGMSRYSMYLERKLKTDHS